MSSTAVPLHPAKEERQPLSFVTGDCVFDGDGAFRLRLGSERISHVLGVSDKEYVDICFGHRERVSRMLDEARRAPGEIWRRLPSSQGSKGPRLYNWTIQALVVLTPGWRRWLLPCGVAWRELSAFVCAVPSETSLERLAAVQGWLWVLVLKILRPVELS